MIYGYKSIIKGNPLMVLTLPTRIRLGKTDRSKFWYLNLNGYRKIYFKTLAKAKVIYTKIVKEELKRTRQIKVRLQGPLIFEYRFYPRNQGRIDTSNPCSIIDKFTADALVNAKIIKDDDWRIIPIVIGRVIGVDPDNPRCELYIYQAKGG